MRETAEPPNNLAVVFAGLNDLRHEIEKILGRPCMQRLIARDATVLQRQILRVLERQVEEYALDQGELRLETVRQCRISDSARPYVARERTRRAPVNVTWGLIEQDYERERATRLGAPVIERARERPLDCLTQARTYLGIEACVDAEQCVDARAHGGRIVDVVAEPEVGDLIGCHTPILSYARVT